jgi:hypothetical protein
VIFKFSASSLIAVALLSAIPLCRAAIARADDVQPVSARPADAEARYARHMDLGVRLFEDRNYDAALSEFELAYEAKRVASPLINIALCHKGRFEYPRAVAVLERALAEHRDTIDAPEKIERAAAELRELLATVEIRVEPASAGASVLLDGVIVPAGDLSALRVSPGSHELVVRAEGYAEARLPFRVASGTSRTLPIALTATSGQLRVTSADPSVRVAIDGVERGVGASETTLPAGNHLVVLRTEDGDVFTFNVSVVAGRPITVALGDDGFAQVGDAPPRGPDEIVRPPVRGVYLTGGVLGGFLLQEELQVAFALDASVGYQVSNAIGLGVTVQQSLPISAGESEEWVSVTNVGPALRITSDTDRVRFLGALQAGFSYALKSTPTGSRGYAGVWLGTELGLEVEIERVIFGFTTPLQGSISEESPGLVGLRLHAGYGFW